ncbi:STAS domain-containing protein [Umezawaea sp.]|uniref:STAS domain-containing protein n=1 Tax=Umezawaea sp. TaxID=1955258 RepID=UPI002ED0A90D
MDGGPCLFVVATRNHAHGFGITSVVGEVDYDSMPRIRSAIDIAAGSGTPHVLDLTGVTFFGAAGLHWLSDLVTDVDHVRVIPSPQVARAMGACGMRPAVSLYPTVSDAVRGLTTPDARQGTDSRPQPRDHPTG